MIYEYTLSALINSIQTSNKKDLIYRQRGGGGGRKYDGVAE
jgi:hypothetical protein